MQQYRPSKGFVARAAVAILLAAIIALYFQVSMDWRARVPIIRSDGIFYYSYLRLYLIHHKIDFEQMPKLADLGDGMHRSEKTGRISPIYPVGTALAELPFVLIGHVAALLGGYPRDGLSPPYQWAVLAAGMVWLLAGLSATWMVLSDHFGRTTASITAAALLFGTNLLHYAIGEPSMSHIYAFGAVAVLLWCAHRFWNTPSVRGAFAMGMAAGFLVSIRNYDLLLVPIALYPALERRGVARQYLLAFLAGGLTGIGPHLIAATYYLGAPWASTYHQIGFFTWTRPQIANVLFSARKGWWFWTPIAAIGFCGLIAGLRTGLKSLCLTAILGIGALIYLVASWADWGMGASFGHRAFVDCLPVVAIGIAVLLRFRWVRFGLPILASMNLALMTAYWAGYINPVTPTARGVARLFRMPFQRLLRIPAHDSTTSFGLAAQVDPPQVEVKNILLVVKTRAHNTGSALWLSDMGIGQIYLAVRTSDDPTCAANALSEWREPIRFDVAPGQSVDLTTYIPLMRLHSPFRYLCAEMMGGLAWFRDVGPSAPAVVEMNSPGFAAYEFQ